jgi:Sperm-tail PG-rich repeat
VPGSISVAAAIEKKSGATAPFNTSTPREFDNIGNAAPGPACYAPPVGTTALRTFDAGSSSMRSKATRFRPADPVLAAEPGPASYNTSGSTSTKSPRRIIAVHPDGSRVLQTDQERRPRTSPAVISNINRRNGNVIWRPSTSIPSIPKDGNLPGYVKRKDGTIAATETPRKKRKSRRRKLRRTKKRGSRVVRGSTGTWSKDKSHRSSVPHSIGPGPGAYDTVSALRHDHKGPSSAFQSKTRRMIGPTRADAPGVGTYSPQSCTIASKARAHASPRKHHIRTVGVISHPERGRTTTPSSGMRRSPIIGGVAERFKYNNSKDATPGPGHYSEKPRWTHSALKAGPHTAQVQLGISATVKGYHIAPRAPFSATVPRFAPVHGASSTDETPGPAAYSKTDYVPTPTPVGKWKNCKSPRFPENKELLPEYSGPGPAAYNPAPVRTTVRSNTTSFGSTSPRFSVDEPTGPETRRPSTSPAAAPSSAKRPLTRNGRPHHQHRKNSRSQAVPLLNQSAMDKAQAQSDVHGYTAGSAGFGSSSPRFSRNNSEPTPASCDYNTSKGLQISTKEVREAPFMSGSPRFAEKTEHMPGPGDYNATSDSFNRPSFNIHFVS